MINYDFYNRAIATEPLFQKYLDSIALIHYAFEKCLLNWHGIKYESIFDGIYNFTTSNHNPHLSFQNIIPNGYDVFACDEPEIYTNSFAPIMYHVTGASCLNYLANGIPIYPAMQHRAYEIYPDKGLLSVQIRNLLFDLCGYSQPDPARWTYSAPQIDSEQIDLQNNLIDSQVDLSVQFLSLLFDTSDKNNKGLILKPWLAKHLFDLQFGNITKENITSETKKQIQNLLDEAHRCLFLREGWYNIISDTLYGIRTPDNVDIEEVVHDFSTLYKSSNYFPNRDRPHLSAVVLEIDTAKLIEDCTIHIDGKKLLPILLGARPLGTILATTKITSTSVRKVYVSRKNLLGVKLSGLPLVDLGEIDSKLFLGDRLPMSAMIEPTSPACAIRYNKSTDWRNLLLSTNICPLEYMDTKQFGVTSKFILHKLLGSIIFGVSEAEYLKDEAIINGSLGEKGNKHPIASALRMMIPSFPGLLRNISEVHPRYFRLNDLNLSMEY